MKPTVAKLIYSYLLSRGDDYVPSGHLEALHFLNATGSTISRKARLLAEEGYLDVKYDTGTHHALYRARKVKGEPQKIEEPTELPKPKVRYEIITKDGVRMARPVMV